MSLLLSLKANPKLGERVAISYPVDLYKMADEMYELAGRIEEMNRNGYEVVHVSFEQNWDTHNFRLIVVAEDKRVFIAT